MMSHYGDKTLVDGYDKVTFSTVAKYGPSTTQKGKAVVRLDCVHAHCLFQPSRHCTPKIRPLGPGLLLTSEGALSAKVVREELGALIQKWVEWGKAYPEPWCTLVVITLKKIMAILLLLKPSQK